MVSAIITKAHTAYWQTMRQAISRQDCNSATGSTATGITLILTQIDTLRTDGFGQAASRDLFSLHSHIHSHTERK